jgi:hypothetical protein
LAASSRVLTIGTTTPCTPASSALPIIHGSLAGTRVIGTTPRPSMARSMSSMLM